MEDDCRLTFSRFRRVEPRDLPSREALLWLLDVRFRMWMTEVEQGITPRHSDCQDGAARQHRRSDHVTICDQDRSGNGHAR